MIKLKLESWSAVAPDIDDLASWHRWFASDKSSTDTAQTPPKLSTIPALLRRRFTTLGKYAAAASLKLMNDGVYLPIVYASRHGDTPLTLSLLESIGRNEPLSPTSFSLAVHNAVGGLLSIARNDASPMTAIASTQNLLPSTLYEAVAQLEEYPRVLCVMYDVPLPEIYQSYSDSLPFPVAVAFVVTRDDDNGTSLMLTPEASNSAAAMSTEQTMMAFIELLAGITDQMAWSAGAQSWSLSGVNHA